MEDIEPLGFVFFKHGGHNWIDKRFYGTITKTEYYRTQVKFVISFRLSCFKCVSNQAIGHNNAVCLVSENCVEGVADKTEDHSQTITNLIDNQTEYDNTDGERPDSCTKKFTCLYLV